MISYELHIQHSKNPLWWQRFIECKSEESINDFKLDIQPDPGGYPRGFTEYINTILEQYDAYFDMGIFGKTDILEFASDEGHMLFMMEWL